MLMNCHEIILEMLNTFFISDNPSAVLYIVVFDDINAINDFNRISYIILQVHYSRNPNHLPVGTVYQETIG